MSVLDELKPTHKFLMMDLLRQAGFDISQWKNYKGNNPATNPKYCYNWSFEQPGEIVAVCLWYPSLKDEKGSVIFRRKPKDFSAYGKGPSAAVWNRRNADFGRNLELAYRQQLPIRVIVVEGKQRNAADLNLKASSVTARLLDPVPWAVTAYNYATGECLLERGQTPVAPAVDSSDLELSWFEGERSKRAFIFHRRREAKARREKIQEALRLNDGRLVCEVQNCNFDFAERYGALGEGYAQVHHLLPLGKAPNEGQPTKLKDLAIVCANCHVMIHANGECRPLAGLIASPR